MVTGFLENFHVPDVFYIYWKSCPMDPDQGSAPEKKKKITIYIYLKANVYGKGPGGEATLPFGISHSLDVMR